MSSTRLPGKVLMEAAGKPFLAHMVERLERVSSLDGIIIATTINPIDDPIQECARQLGVECFRGSEDDVLQRVLDAAIAYNVDVIVEMTGDCPLIDPALVESCIQEYLETGYDYVSNVLERTYPIGMDTQVFSTKTLAEAAESTNDPKDREHVSLYIYRHPERYRLRNILGPSELTRPKLRLTLDTQEDFQLLRRIFEELYPTNCRFGLAEILALIDERPDLAELNAHVQHQYV